jgi:hypothetical protein
MRRSLPLLAFLLAACATARPVPAPPPTAVEPAAPAAPWDAAPFSADSDRLLLAAAALPPPPDASAEALVAEATVEVDPAGDRLIARRVVRTLPGLSPGQGAVALGWDPRREDRPELRARAIWPDGTVRWMEPVDFADVALDDGTRALRVELPVEPGMVIEQVSTGRRHPAASGRGRLPLSAGMPTRLARVAVSAPPDAPVRAAARGVDLAPRDVLSDGRHVLSFELAPVPADGNLPFPPPEFEAAPAVEWTAAASWADAVGPAADAVEAVLAAAASASTASTTAPGPTASTAPGPTASAAPVPRPAVPAASAAAAPAPAASGPASARAPAPGNRSADPLAPLLRGLDRRGTPAAVAGRLLARLRRRTAIDPGPVDAASLAPAAPAATLAATKASSLDAAALLAAALRSAGIDATVALARDRGADPLPDLPALDGAYRVLLALPDGSFLDPAYAEAPALPVPAAVEGRLAIVLSRARPGPSSVPALPASASRSTVTREVRFAGKGPARIVETIEGTGHLAAAYRAAWAEGGLDRFRATVGDLEGWALGGKAEGFHVEPGAPGRPFRARFEVKQAKGAVRAGDGATVRLPPTALFFRLPVAGEDGRRVDVVLPFAHVATLSTRVFAPPGLAPAEPPPTAPVPLGPLAVRREVQAGRGPVETRLVLDVDRRRFTPAEVDAMVTGAAVLTLSSELRLVPASGARRSATGMR